MKAVLTAICLTCACAAQAEIYKWVDKEGVVHYADTKPDDENLGVKNFLGTPVKIDDRGLAVQEEAKSSQKPGSVKTENQLDMTLSGFLVYVKACVNRWLGNHSQGDTSARQELILSSSDTVVISNDNMGEVLEQIAQEKQALQKQEEAHARPRVEIFTTPWCGYCKKAIAFLKMNKISYEEYDVSSNTSAALRQQMLGGSGGVPFAVVNGEKIRGWNKQAYARALGL